MFRLAVESVYVVTLIPTVAICDHLDRFVDRSTLKPVSLFELSAQVSATLVPEVAAAERFVGAADAGNCQSPEVRRSGPVARQFTGAGRMDQIPS